MRTILIFLGALMLAAGPSAAQQTDEFAWLEEIEGTKALDWARARNTEALAFFQADSRYETLKTEAEDILQSTDRIPYFTRRGVWLYNFWQDKDHVRGIWRRTTLEEYRKPSPNWETMLDVDTLGAVENKSWVYKDAICLPPAYLRCMIKLSDGGKDASVWREFDVMKKAFLPEGFTVPEAKSDLAWLDENALLLGTDFGPGSLTDSGYPRVVKRWRRGEPLEKATTVFEGAKEDVSAWPWVSHRPEGTTVMVGKSPSFFTSQIWILNEQGERVRIPLPDDAQLKGVFQGRMLATLRTAWKDFPAGALIAMDLAEVRGAKADPRTVLVYELGENSGFSGGLSLTQDAVVFGVMTDVKTALHEARFDRDGEAMIRKLPGRTDGTAFLSHADDYSNDIFFGYTDFLTPTSLLHLREGALEPELLKALPAKFDASGVDVQQFFTVSKDGEAIPYFLVGQKGMKFDGKNPTLLYGYGGFEASMTPGYNAALGKMWLERGGVYVLANIRGGGEYGPAWHRAALKENRQKAFDDFIAVAEDLIYQNITSPRRLGIMGGSNGGLLVGAVAMQRPKLFNAVVCQVPLLDMLRYNKLLAGASWMGEYGNPDDPAMREVIRKYSPYQNVLWYKERRYPEIFFITSTKDDRVHPGHARKMVAKMLGRNHRVWYYENIEGGHSAAADLKQAAMRKALEFTYLLKYLKD